MSKNDKDLIKGELDLDKAEFKKTVYLDSNVLAALRDEADRRGVKAIPLINQILKEILLDQPSIERRLTIIETYLDLKIK